MRIANVLLHDNSGEVNKIGVEYDGDKINDNWSVSDEVMELLNKYNICPDNIELKEDKMKTKIVEIELNYETEDDFDYLMDNVIQQIINDGMLFNITKCEDKGE